MRLVRTLALVALAAGAVIAADATAQDSERIRVDPNLWVYQKTSQPVSGNSSRPFLNPQPAFPIQRKVSLKNRPIFSMS